MTSTTPESTPEVEAETTTPEATEVPIVGIVAVDIADLLGIKPDPEDSFTHEELWAMTEDAIEQATKAIRGEEHSTLPLLKAIVLPRVRDALLMYVLTEGESETMKDALWVEHKGELVNETLDGILKNQVEPNALSHEAIAYLEETVMYDMDVAAASDEAKAQLYTLGAVLAFWHDNDVLIHRALAGADTFGGNRLSHLVKTAHERGIRPAWVASA